MARRYNSSFCIFVCNVLNDSPSVPAVSSGLTACVVLSSPRHATRDRVGDFSSCGDLLFSGHAAFTTLTMLVFVKSWRGHATYRVWKVLGVVYLLSMCTLAIAGRKHYTVRKSGEY